MIVNNKYRKVWVDVDAIPITDPVLANLNRRFDPDDFHVVRDGARLHLWLREVSIDDLKTAVSQITEEHPETSTALQAIPATVDDIRSYGINGRKRLFVDYNAERKVIGRKDKILRRGKHYYANDHKFAAANNIFPDKFTNAIICGDSEAVLKNLPDNCVDLIFTSPPYNFGLEYQANNDATNWEAYFDKLFVIFSECIRVLTFGGRIVINIQPLFSDYIPSHHIISNFFMKQRLIWKGEILWEKNNYNCKYTAWGSWKSPASPYLKYSWEFLEIFCKGNLKKNGTPDNADIDAESFKNWVVAKWSIAPEGKMKSYGHPAMFPEELARRVMLLFSFVGDVVLDPFAGVGTACVVAHRIKRQYLGVDVSPDYCDLARQRLNNTNCNLLL